MLDLCHKTVLVTGASRGIGAVTAETLSRAGASVILHYGQGRTEAEALADRLNQGAIAAALPQRCWTLSVDLADPQGPKRLWEGAIALCPEIDVVVNNAAVMPAAGITDPWEVWTEAWHVTLQVNLVAVADLCRLAIQHFQTRSQGILINVASRAAFRGDGPDFMHYAASKGGVVALTRSIARGFAKDQVLAYAIAPGFVHTDRIEQVMQAQGAEYVTADIPMGTPAPPQDIANMIAFLATGAVPHATGSTFDINGASYVR